MAPVFVLLGILFGMLIPVDMVPVKVSTKRKYFIEKDLLDLLYSAVKCVFYYC